MTLNESDTKRRLWRILSLSLKDLRIQFLYMMKIDPGHISICAIMSISLEVKSLKQTGLAVKHVPIRTYRVQFLVMPQT